MLNVIFQGFPGFGGFGDGFQLSFGIGAFPFAFFSTVSLASFNLRQYLFSSFCRININDQIKLLDYLIIHCRHLVAKDRLQVGCRIIVIKCIILIQEEAYFKIIRTYMACCNQPWTQQKEVSSKENLANDTPQKLTTFCPKHNISTKAFTNLNQIVDQKVVDDFKWITCVSLSCDHHFPTSMLFTCIFGDSLINIFC